MILINKNALIVEQRIKQVDAQIKATTSAVAIAALREQRASLSEILKGYLADAKPEVSIRRKP
jgi:G3E family GTPase